MESVPIMYGFTSSGVRFQYFLNFPCNHTRYIFNCRLRLTSSRRSTPSCSTVNRGWGGQFGKGDKRFLCTLVIPERRGRPEVSPTRALSSVYVNGGGWGSIMSSVESGVCGFDEDRDPVNSREISSV